MVELLSLLFRVNETAQYLVNRIELVSSSDIKDVDENVVWALVETISKTFGEKDIFSDDISIEAKYKYTVYLKSLDSKSYLLQRNQVLLPFINGCCI